MIIERLLRDHIVELNAQHAEGAEAILNGSWFQDLVRNGPAFAGVTATGEVIAAMGMLKQNSVSYRCWAITSPTLLPRYMVGVCKQMRKFMDGLIAEQGAKRIETIVRDGNDKAHRWIKLLGFNNPHLLRHFDEHGDAWLYERII